MRLSIQIQFSLAGPGIESLEEALPKTQRSLQGAGYNVRSIELRQASGGFRSVILKLVAEGDDTASTRQAASNAAFASLPHDVQVVDAQVDSGPAPIQTTRPIDALVTSDKLANHSNTSRS